MAKRSLAGLLVAALLATGEPALAQSPPAAGAEEQGATLALAAPVLQVGLLMGSAWIGAVLAGRFFDSNWFALIGARIGAGLGLETAASLGVLGIGVGGALPASRALAPQLAAGLPSASVVTETLHSQ